jgi:hypothetical protein
MASTFEYEGKRYDIVENLTFGEISWVERNSGQNLNQMGSADGMAAGILLSLRRQGVNLTWKDIMNVDPSTLNVQNDEPEAAGTGDEVPTSDGAEAVPSV